MNIDYKKLSFELASEIGELKAKCGDHSLWRTFHLLDKVSRGLGWEIAEKLGDKTACNDFDRKVNQP